MSLIPVAFLFQVFGLPEPNVFVVISGTPPGVRPSRYA